MAEDEKLTKATTGPEMVDRLFDEARAVIEAERYAKQKAEFVQRQIDDAGRAETHAKEHPK